MIKIPVNTAMLLADNLRARARLGLTAIDRAEQARLQAWLNPAPLALLTEQPLSGQDKELLADMLQVAGITLQQVVFEEGPARLRMRLCCQAPANSGQGWCWHPAMLIKHPQLKKQAYAQLKQLKTVMRGKTGQA